MPSPRLLLATLVVAVSAHGAAIFTGIASVTCAPTDGPTEQVSTTVPARVQCPSQFPGPSYAQANFSINEFGLGGYIVASASLVRDDGFVEASVNVDWTNTFVATGGTGAAEIAFAVSTTPVSFIGCPAVSIDGGPAQVCRLSAPIVFGVPFTLRVLLNGTVKQTVDTAGGNVTWNIYRVERDGVAVDGAAIEAIPEPSTAALLSVSLATVFVHRRRAARGH